MANEILEGLIRINLAATAAILLVLLLRGLVRRIAGPMIAYGLWLAVPVAALASLLPPRKVVTFAPAPATEPAAIAEGGAPVLDAVVAPAPASAAPAIDWMAASLGLWLAVAVAGVAWLLWRQHRFLRHVGETQQRGARIHALRSDVGPAVVGVLKPRILVPADFDARFSPREQDVVLAHETFHLTQGHAQTNAAVLLAQCLNWFNPLIHVAGRVLRLDQELACDAAVVARFPNARRSYAEAMLKTQLAPTALPLGCYWPAKGASVLKQRLSMLQVPTPSRWRMGLGGLVAVSLAAAAGVAAWAAQPAQTVVVQTPARAVPAGAAPATPPTVLAGPGSGSWAPLPPTLVSQATVQAAKIAEAARSNGEVAETRAELADEVKAARQALNLAREQGAIQEEVADALQEVRYAQVVLAAFDGPLRASPSKIAPRPARDFVSVEPGKTVVVRTSTVTPSGNKIGGEGVFVAGRSDIDGYYNAEARYSLISDVRQVGDEVELTPKFYLDGKLIGTTVVRIPSGQSREVRLNNGQVIQAYAHVFPSNFLRKAAFAPDAEQATRTLPFLSDTLAVHVRADVIYRPGPAASITITGPKDAVENIILDDGAIRYDHGTSWRYEKYPNLRIVVTAPGVTEFHTSGSQVLEIRDYASDDIDIHVSGSAVVKVAGRARDADVRVSGSGHVDLSNLRAQNGDFRVSGSGSIRAGPVDAASAGISGSGVVRFTTEPKSLEKRIAGSGRVILPDVAAKPPRRSS